MKKLLIIAALAVFAAAGTASAQNYMVVNTETIFKSMTAYNQAVEEMDAAAQQYQQNIDNAYAELEDMYETYMSQKASLSQSARQQREETILNNEKKIAEYQASIFGEDGKMTRMPEKGDGNHLQVRLRPRIFARTGYLHESAGGLLQSCRRQDTGHHIIIKITT